MYQLANILFSNYGIMPATSEGSNIALAGFLDMPARLGKTHHVWQETGVEPYVSFADINLGGRTMYFTGLLNQSTKANVITQLNAFYTQIKALQELTLLTTPYGNFKVYVKDEIEVIHLDKGVAKIKIPFRQPKVVVPANFVSPLFVSTDFIEKVSNPIIETYPTPNFTVYGVDGIPFTELGMYVTAVENNFNLPAKQDQNTVEDGLTEQFQITNTGLKIVQLKLVAIAPTLQLLKENTNAFFVLLAKPETREIQIDGRVLNAFNTQGFAVKNIKKQTNCCVAVIEVTLNIV